MSQFLWTVVEERPVSLHKAARFVERCARDLRQSLDSTVRWGGLLSQLSTLAQGAADAHEAMRASGYRASRRHKPKPEVSKNSNRDVVPILSEKTSSPTDAGPRALVVGSIMSSPFVQITARGTALLHPCYLTEPLKGTKAFIATLLFRHVPEFRGLWIAFHPKQLTCPDGVGYVHEADPFGMIDFQVELKCLIFRPEPHTVLPGTVTQVRPAHVVLVILGTFNCCLLARDFTQFYEYTDEALVLRDGRAPLRDRCPNRIALDTCLIFQLSLPPVPIDKASATRGTFTPLTGTLWIDNTE